MKIHGTYSFPFDDHDILSIHSVLYLPLYHAERAWSYAMELKEQDHNEKMEQGEDANSRLKFHLHGRLRKAAEWSQRLMNMCSLRGDVYVSISISIFKF